MSINPFYSHLGLILGLGLLLPAAVAAQNKAPAFDTVTSQSGDIKIYPINHATLALVWQGKTVYVDPVGGAAAFRGLPAPDLILITHIHGDHFSVPTLTPWRAPRPNWRGRLPWSRNCRPIWRVAPRP